MSRRSDHGYPHGVADSDLRKERLRRTLLPVDVFGIRDDRETQAVRAAFDASASASVTDARIELERVGVDVLGLLDSEAVSVASSDGLPEISDPGQMLDELLALHDLEPPRVIAFLDGVAVDPSQVLGLFSAFNRLRPSGDSVRRFVRGGGSVGLIGVDEALPGCNRLADVFERALGVAVRIDLLLADRDSVVVRYEQQSTVMFPLSGEWTISPASDDGALESGASAGGGAPWQLTTASLGACLLVHVPPPTWTDVVGLVSPYMDRHPLLRADLPTQLDAASSSYGGPGVPGPEEMSLELETLFAPEVLRSGARRYLAGLPPRYVGKFSEALVGLRSPQLGVEVRCPLPGGLHVVDGVADESFVAVAGGGWVLEMARSEAMALALVADGRWHSTGAEGSTMSLEASLLDSWIASGFVELRTMS